MFTTSKIGLAGHTGALELRQDFPARIHLGDELLVRLDAADEVGAGALKFFHEAGQCSLELGTERDEGELALLRDGLAWFVWE